jgi:putative acetyltransferase
MAAAQTVPGLRPFLPADGPRLAELFRASVERLAEDYYDQDQLAAWIGRADDEDAFTKRLAAGLTLVGLLQGEVAGFASLKDNKSVDMLYVHPDFARRGVASALLDALEKLAAARGARQLSVDASDAARDFFAARGYVPQSRNTVVLGEEWLGNTTMTKELALHGSRAATGNA